jgi:hypothetical protein
VVEEPARRLTYFSDGTVEAMELPPPLPLTPRVAPLSQRSLPAFARKADPMSPSLKKKSLP